MYLILKYIYEFTIISLSSKTRKIKNISIARGYIIRKMERFLDISIISISDGEVRTFYVFRLYLYFWTTHVAFIDLYAHAFLFYKQRFISNTRLRFR